MELDGSRRIEPIILVFAETGGRKIVRTARQAAEVLMQDWPIDDGEEFFTAVKTCLDVITGDAEPDRLRQAIIRAAAEAGIAAITVIG
ncbi:DUF982 domain-containing protein [Rhizobium lentis]|uniref:DUF982 domain-containing protein n=1 Tax=Rhizobium lentis TaxID=1138194 RepID=UPI001C82A723|nr:DUF982 domain-containing protein [Rhizobium lentis]MBX5135344.1 DUF982 domain-containing protein [Rhizobium lentis]